MQYTVSHILHTVSYTLWPTAHCIMQYTVATHIVRSIYIGSMLQQQLNDLHIPLLRRCHQCSGIILVMADEVWEIGMVIFSIMWSRVIVLCDVCGVWCVVCCVMCCVRCVVCCVMCCVMCDVCCVWCVVCGVVCGVWCCVVCCGVEGD